MSVGAQDRVRHAARGAEVRGGAERDLKIRERDGDETELALPPAPNLDDLDEQLRNGEIPRHTEGGP